MGERIRWTDDDPAREYAIATGSIGPSDWNWVPFGIYEEFDGPVAGLKTHFLTSDLPGQERRRYFGHPDDLKDEAEAWLAHFVSSLGAVFPDEAFDFDSYEDEEPLEARFAAGRCVRFAHPDAGWPGEKEHAAATLILGAVYVIGWADIGQSRTDLNLYRKKKWVGRFNSVFFEPANDEPDESATSPTPAEET